MFLSKCLELGINIFIPFGESKDFDFIVDLDGKLLRVQCKTGRIQQNANKQSIAFNMGSVCHRKGKSVRLRVTNLDAYAVYVPESGKLYLIPFSEDFPSNIARLSLIETKRMKWRAADYEMTLEHFRNAVAKRGR